MTKSQKAIALLFSIILLTGVTVSAQKSSKRNAPQKNVSAKSIKTNSIRADKKSLKAAAFELEDQFNKKFALKFPAKKVSVLVFGDRKGAEQIEGWVRPLFEKYTDKIEIYGIAELSAVPWIAKGFVRNAIKSKTKSSIMLDWSGKVSKDYDYESEKANLFVVSKDGYIVAEKSGAATPAELEDLFNAIGDLK